eukprot:7165994-Lingulodinium_polyedra.AAC.1
MADHDEKEVEPQSHLHSECESREVVDKGGALCGFNDGVVCHGPKEHTVRASHADAAKDPSPWSE